MGALRFAVLCCVAVLAVASPASAAPHFLGTGHDPGVAVDAAGTAHVAWLSSGPGDTGVLQYCRFPRGARTCAARTSVPLEADGFGKVQVLLVAGSIRIIAPLLTTTPLLTSIDNGATFTRTEMGALPAIEAALPGPAGTFSVMSGSGPARVGRFAPDGSGLPAGLPVEFAPALDSLETTLAPFGAGLLAAFSGSGMRSVIWNGAGDPNLQQSWVEGPRLGKDRTSPAAVGGRSGTYLAYVDRRGGRSDVRVRRLARNGRLGRERRIGTDDPVQLSAAQGPRGDIVVMWSQSESAMYVRSRSGRRWTRPRRLFSGSGPEDLRTALGPRGGWVVWDGNAGNAGSHPIRIAAIPRAPRR